MVNEFVPQSPKKDDEESLCDGKGMDSESSDEDTTSSSLMPIPDTLDVMRNELKSTISNFCESDYSAAKHPTEREVSIARKITSANLLLDELLNVGNILPKNVKDKNPLVFAAGKTNRQRRSSSSETSDPSSGTCSSCPVIPVAAFAYPQTMCECSRAYPSEKKEPVPIPEVPSDESPGVIIDLQKSEKKNFLLEKVRYMKLRCMRKKGRTVNESQQTLPPRYAPEEEQGVPCSCHQMGLSFPRRSDNCTCTPECTCYPVIGDRKTRKITKDAQCGSDEGLQPDDSNGSDNTPYEDKQMGVKVPVMAIPGRRKERIDIYYFDHGNSSYYRTTDSHRARYTEYMLDRTDEYASKFWAEVFGTVTIVIAFVVSFLLQLYRFVFTAVIRALTVGLIQIFSDYFFKPLLTVLFNGLIQPSLILGYNIATSLKDFCIPMCEICEFCAKDLAIIFGSCRLVEVKQRDCTSPDCHCRHNV